MSELTAALLVSMDSCIAGIGIGVLQMSFRARAALAIAFGLCDGIGTLVGTLIHHRAPDVPDALTYLVAVVLIVLAGRGSKVWLCAMPVVFSLDNLAAGDDGGLGPLAAAASSCAMAALGIAIGAAIVHVVRERLA